MASISGSFLYGFASCESNGLMPDFINMLASTRYLRHVVRLQQSNKHVGQYKVLETRLSTTKEKLCCHVEIVKTAKNRYRILQVCHCGHLVKLGCRWSVKIMKGSSKICLFSRSSHFTKSNLPSIHYDMLAHLS